MYHLKDALVIGRTVGAQWSRRDLSDVFVQSAYLEFKKIFLILNHPSSIKEIYVDMDVVRNDVYSFNGSFAQWLSSLNGRSLPHVEEIPDGRMRYVRYSNSEQSMYKLEPAHAGLHYPEGVNLKMLPDIKISRPQFKTDMNLTKDCLFTVNGFIHNSVETQDEAFILDGAKTAYQSKDCEVGIISFLDVGSLKKIKIDISKVHSSDPDSSLYERLKFSTEESLENKTYFLVLGGYLVLPKDNVFFQSGDRTFTLTVKDLDYEDRILESIDKIDLSSLNLTQPNINKKAIDLAELRSDERIKKYLELPQSFLVIVDSPYLSVERKVITRSSYPGTFLTQEDPVQILIGKNGKVLDYWKKKENGFWSAVCKDTFNRQYIYKEIKAEDRTYITPTLDTTRRYEHSQAYLLEISTIKD